MRSYFVTATGTDIGKTYVSTRLISAWREAGYVAQATKPLMSGFSEDDLEQSDAGRLLAAMGQAATPEAVSEICLHRLTPPIAPNIAMRQAGIVQDYKAISGFVARRLGQPADFHLVEGAGGVMSPLTDSTLQINLITDLKLPVVLVTAPYLGSISHTLTAIDALQAQGLKISAIAVSQPDASGSPEKMFEFIGEIKRFRDLSLFAVGHLSGAKDLAQALSLQD